MSQLPSALFASLTVVACAGAGEKPAGTSTGYGTPQCPSASATASSESQADASDPRRAALARLRARLAAQARPPVQYGDGGGPPIAYPPPPEAAELCKRPGNLVSIRDYDAMRKVIVGRWMRCTGTLWNEPHEGIDFADDGTFRLLYRDKNGKIVAGSGFDAQGTWEIASSTRRDPSAPSGDIPLTLTRESSIMSVPRFTKEPVKMRLPGLGSPAVEFVRLADVSRK